MSSLRMALSVATLSTAAVITLVSCGEPGFAKQEKLQQHIPPLGQLPELPESYFPPPPSESSEPPAPPTSQPQVTVTTTVTSSPPPPSPPPPPPPEPEPDIYIPLIDDILRL